MDALEDQIFTYLKRGAVSFVEIENRFGQGDYTFYLKKNVILWSSLPLRLSEKSNFRIFQLYCLKRTGRSIVIWF